MIDDDRDPFYDNQTRQLINQINSAAGGIAILPDEWDEVAALSDALNCNTDIQLPHDNNPVAQRMAAWLMSWAVIAEGERSIDSRWCPAYDDAKPPPGQLYALVFGINDDLIPLQHIEQHKDVAKTLLGDVVQCHAHLTADCFTALPATKFLAVMRLDYVCLFKVCSSCLKALDTVSVDSPEYTGPDEWFDDRKGPQPDPDDDDPFS